MIKCYDHYTTVYWKNTNLVNLNTLNRGISKATRFHVWKMIKRTSCRIFHNKPDMSMLDKVKKEWFIIEGTVCMPGTIPARTMFKRDKYADLKFGVKSLYPRHKVSSIEVVFVFIAAYSINLEKELTKILEDKKVVNAKIERSQKWIISQNCGIAKRFTLQ